MRKPSFQLKPENIKASLKTRTFRVGGYSVFAVLLVLAIVIVVNVLVNVLPDSITRFDTTANQLFSISEQTENIVNNLKEDITVYWIVQSGQEDTTLETLLGRYESMSSHIHVVKKDPDVYPTFIQQYVSDGVYNNSLIVESEQRYTYVSYSDIYEYDYSNYYTTYTYDVNFAGESALTSAVDYVVSDALPKVYALTGHGESELASTFESAVSKENIDLEELSLLASDSVPEDADAVFIYAPQSDISSEEKEILLAYLQEGGHMILITDPPQEDTQFMNLMEVMTYYGVSAVDGIIIETDQSKYGLGMPYCLLPDMASHTITNPLSNSGYYVLLPIAQGLTVSESRDGVSVTELLTTSTSAFSKAAGYALTTYEKEDGDIDGPFAVAVAVTETLEADDEENEAETQIVWVSSAALLDEQTNVQVSGGNQDFFLNCLNWMCDKEESISIHAKNMSYEYLTMNSAAASMLTMVMVGIIPVCYLGIGICIWRRRKHR